MTTLTITPKIVDKTARFKGAVAAGEHVAVTIKGGAEWLGEDDGANLTLRVLDLVTGRTLAVFPRPQETMEEGETPDAWSAATEDANDLYCELNLNTTRMVAAARHMLRVPVLFVLGDTDDPRTLYFRDRHEVEYWPERIGDTTPYDLDNWPKQIDDWTELVTEWQEQMSSFGAALSGHTGNGGIHVTAEQKVLWTAKQDAINDLDTIRSGAAAGATAIQGHQDISGKIDRTEILSGGKVKESLLPSYVDDVLEYESASAFPATGETGKIYVAKDENKTYRWSGTQYVQIGGGGSSITIDPSLSPTSENPVQNKVVTEAFHNELARLNVWTVVKTNNATGDVVETATLAMDSSTANSPTIVFRWDEGDDFGYRLFYMDGEWTMYGRSSQTDRIVEGGKDSASLTFSNSVYTWTWTRHYSLKAMLNDVSAALAAKANASDVATALALKSDADALPYALVTPGEWTFSDGQSHTVYGPSEGVSGWLYTLDDEQTGDFSNYFSTESDALAALSLTFLSVTATRPSIPGHLCDRAGNRVVVTGDTTLTLPEIAHAGRLRDFLVRLVVSATSAVTWTVAQGETWDAVGAPPSSFAAGTYLYRVTEVAAGVWHCEDMLALVGLEAALAGKQDKYPMVTVAPSNGTLTIAPYTVATYTAGSSAASFTVAVGAGTTGRARDCELVIDCTATGAVAPTVIWPATFHPRTDAGTDFACEAGVRNVYYISEYAPGEYAVGGWMETEGGNA